jgi:hypothetical protein
MQFLLPDADPGLLIDYATDAVLMGESLQQVLGQSVPGMGTMFVMLTVFQASGSSLLLTLTRAPLGGARWPMDISPKFMRIVGHVSPVAWAMHGFTALT